MQTTCNDQNLCFIDNVTDDRDCEFFESFRVVGALTFLWNCFFVCVSFNEYIVARLTLQDISIEHTALACTSVLNVLTNNSFSLQNDSALIFMAGCS